MNQYEIYVDGVWRKPASGKYFETDDPFLAEPWARIPRCDKDDVNAAVDAAYAAFTTGPWSRMTATARGAVLRKMGDVLDTRGAELAQVESRDNGKRVSEILPQLSYLKETYYYYAGLADKIEGAVIPNDMPGVFNYTRYEPLGVVAAITPWNSPLMLGSWKIAPALAAGNTVIIKPPKFASASTLEMMRLFEDVNVPPGVLNVVTGFGSEVGEMLVTHPRVAKVSFTGSDNVGQRISELAARQIKPVTLELGGKSPQIVFEDADMDNAVHGVISGIFLSNGQTCVAGSRLYLHDNIHDAFVKKIKAVVEKVRLGDPKDSETQVGPIANRQQYETILKYLDGAKSDGASCVLGGNAATRPECGNGWFVEPTILTDVRPNMTIVREEIFGPVLCVMRFNDEEEVLAHANDTEFGLAAGVWTSDLRRAIRFSERLQAGTVYINNYRSVSTTSPVGGYKRSGYGRENGVDAIKSYLQVKSVWLSVAEEIANPFA